MERHFDLEYARVGSRPLLLDLYLPDDGGIPLPVILWIHGGAWREGNKDHPRALPLVREGYAVASVEYRLSQEAIFPAQMHDCKAAVRWLRAMGSTATVWERGEDLPALIWQRFWALRPAYRILREISDTPSSRARSRLSAAGTDPAISCG